MTATVKKVLVVDDEPPARARLAAMLEAIQDVEVCELAENGDAALLAASLHRPDIVLMDIRMPGKDGLQAAAELAESDRPPAVIFCTAFDEHALEAFRANAVEYLLKPVRREQLERALAKAQRLNRAQLASINEAEKLPEDAVLIARTHSGEERLQVGEIRALLADQKYVSAYLPGREILVDESLKGLEEKFPGYFLRIHRNALVGVKYIEALETDRAGGIEQHRLRLGGVDVRPVVSRRLLPAVRRRLRQG